MRSNDILLLFTKNEIDFKYSITLRCDCKNFRIILINNHRH